MTELEIHTASGRSRIILGEQFTALLRYIPKHNVIIITDENVNEQYSSQFPPFPVIQIGAGEKVKNLDTVQYIYNRLITLHADRSTFILGIGGGVVCDITGFVASTFLRGLSFGYVSTSLLSQVDASLGGKNGINFSGYKNLIGIIKQPDFVFCDPGMLDTLPYREYISGFAEIIKHALIRDEEMFQQIESNVEPIVNRNRELIYSLIADSIEIKASIVREDENEQDVRRLLNYGHTFGHAIEKVHGLKHGEAIGMGMVMANRFAVQKGVAEPEEMLRITRLLETLELLKKVQLDKEKVWEAVLVDKKKYGEEVCFVWINRIGNACVDRISLEELRLFLDEFKM
jgi:3-dehydroquinate synthase